MIVVAARGRCRAAGAGAYGLLRRSAPSRSCSRSPWSAASTPFPPPASSLRAHAVHGGRAGRLRGLRGGPGARVRAPECPTGRTPLLKSSFDRFADQLPANHEMKDAIEKRQVLVVRHEKTLAAALFFETQGFTSTVRFWVVAEAFRAHRFGSGLIRHYFASHAAVRRLTSGSEPKMRMLFKNTRITGILPTDWLTTSW